MIKLIVIFTLFISAVGCASLNNGNYTIKCDECIDYIRKELAPQIENCIRLSDSYDACKFDIERINKFGSCLLGMKKNEIEDLIGNYYWRHVKNRDDMGKVINLIYYEGNQRLVGIREIIPSNLNKSVTCLDCSMIYGKIRTKSRIKKMSFEEFHERYKGCFYGKTSDFLVSKLNLQDKIKEGKYQHSYNKYVLLGRDTHYLNFLFYADHKMVDISPVDSIMNRVIK